MKGEEQKWDMSAIEESWKYYNRAKTIFPYEGKVYHQLAVVSVKEQDYLATTYYYMWSLACHFPFQTARENLIDHFEEIRMKLVQ